MGETIESNQQRKGSEEPMVTVQSEGYKAGFRLSLRNSVQRASRELNIP
jgi:hypothetical protein